MQIYQKVLSLQKFHLKKIFTAHHSFKSLWRNRYKQNIAPKADLQFSDNVFISSKENETVLSTFISKQQNNGMAQTKTFFLNYPASWVADKKQFLINVFNLGNHDTQ